MNINRSSNVRKVVWIEYGVFQKLKKISSNRKNRVTLYSLVNDLLNYALNNLDYDEKSGEINYESSDK